MVIVSFVIYVEQIVDLVDCLIYIKDEETINRTRSHWVYHEKKII